jgi:bifunctional DNA-binding transcriptional regulator/antitoxin component of YhaV-PrlF toxin-antitoxin module
VDVVLPDGYHALVILPAKFRKQIWIRKGGFVIVQVALDEEDEKGQRSFNGEIVRVLLKDDEKHLRGLEGGKYWPEKWRINDGDGEIEAGAEEEDEFGAKGDTGDTGDTGEEEQEGDRLEIRSDSSDDELPTHLQRVSNRRRVQYRDDSSSSDDD